MAKINIDLTTKVDISAREGDTFELDLGITKEDGSSFDLTNEDIIFVVYGEGNTPVLLLSSGETPAYITSYYINGLVTAEMLQKARAVSKLIECDINLFTFVEYSTYIMPRFLDNANGSLTNIYNVIKMDGGVRLIVQAHAFNLPQGSYSYELKVASDLRDVMKGVNYNTASVMDSYYKNSATWMEGKFTVNKN